MATPISIHSQARFNIQSRMDTKSMKSSDNSSSGNGSDVELLSSKKSKNRNSYYQQQQQQQMNYYEIGPINTSNKSDKSEKSSSRNKVQQRSLEQVPKEQRNSKHSFNANETPREFFVDVM